MVKNKQIWSSGISPTSTLSYEKYISAGLYTLSNNLTLRSYKLAPKEDYPFFERGRDIRIVIFWKGKPASDVNGKKYEFIVEVPFWFSSNRNKEDRRWMRSHANAHLEIFYDAIQRGKEQHNKQKIAEKPTNNVIIENDKSLSSKAGSTQDVFEKVKKNAS